MASGSKQLKGSLLVVAALLLLICTCTTRGQAARPEPGSKDDHMPQVSIRQFLFHSWSLCISGHACASYNLSLCYLQRAVSATVSGNEKSGSAAGVEMHLDEPEEMRECEGGDDEREECLMRRTLVAHTDYIYTQGKHN